MMYMPMRFTRSVKLILIISFFVFLVQQTGDQFFGTHLMNDFSLVPSGFFRNFQIWQIFTYSFLHNDVMHLFFDLLMIVFIGSELEFTWGGRRFLRYYFICTTGTGLFYLLLQAFVSRAIPPMMGASGAIYGLLMAYGLLFSERVLLFMMLFPMKAKHFIWVLALIEFMTSLYSQGGKVWSSIGHLGGMITSLIYLGFRALVVIMRKKEELFKLSSFSKKRRSRHLKLIINNDREFESDDEDKPGGSPKTWH
jgi:membrane associated rhomboid family serine protease